MARRYFVDDSDNTISGLTDIDEVEVPTGYSAVLESTIRAVDPPGADGRIRSGSTWDGSTYTAATPDGLLIPYDADTELGRRQIASTILHQYLKGVTEGVHAVRHEKSQADVEKVEQFIAMAHWATYVAANMGILTDNFETWVTLMTAGPSERLDRSGILPERPRPRLRIRYRRRRVRGWTPRTRRRWSAWMRRVVGQLPLLPQPTRMRRMGGSWARWSS